MTSPPLDSTHDWQHRVWHAIIAFGQHTQSNDIGRSMTSPPLEYTHGRMTSGVTCHHLIWTAHTVERRRAGHAIIAYGWQTRSNEVRRDMPSPPLDSTHGRQGRAWHDITALGQHTQSNDVGRGMTSHPLDSTHGRQRRAWHDITALGQHTRSNDVGRDVPSPPFDNTHGRTTLGMA